MAQDIFNSIIFSIIAGGASIIGMLSVLYFSRFAKKYSTYSISFAVGVLITIAFTHLLPESLELNSNAILITLVGFLTFYLIEHFVMIHSCHEDECEVHHMGTMSAIGIGFHSLIDGVAIGIGFEVSNEIGLFTALAVLLHKLPEGINTMSIMIHSRMNKKKAIMYSTFVALATIIGTIIALIFTSKISENTLGALLAFAAGSFIYIGASDLLPETHHKFNKMNAVILFAGVFFVISLGALF